MSILRYMIWSNVLRENNTCLFLFALGSQMEDVQCFQRVSTALQCLNFKFSNLSYLLFNSIFETCISRFKGSQVVDGNVTQDIRVSDVWCLRNVFFLGLSLLTHLPLLSLSCSVEPSTCFPPFLCQVWQVVVWQVVLPWHLLYLFFSKVVQEVLIGLILSIQMVDTLKLFCK